VIPGQKKWRLVQAGALCCILSVVVVPSVHGSSTKLPDPRQFRIRAPQLPWHTNFLLDARVESNRQATIDGSLIYDPTVDIRPSWDSLHRITGWYEDAVMHRGTMSPVTDILVSEFKTVNAARTAHRTEVAATATIYPITSRPKLGSEAEESASTGTGKDKGKAYRVESSTVFVLFRNLELDTTVYDSHAPRYHWLKYYRQLSLAIARRLTTIAQRVARPTSATPLPTATVKPTRTSTPTMTPTSTPIPTPTLVPTATASPTVPSTATASPTPQPTATNFPTVTPLSTFTPIPPSPTSVPTVPVTLSPAQTVQASATVSNANPTDNSTVVVFGHLTVNGQGIVGVPMNTTWYYKTTTVGCSGETDSSGTASCSRDIARATRGFFVRIDVVFTYNGQAYTTSTGFTPQ